MSYSHYTFTPELEEKLNDIDEFIRTQSGADELSAAGIEGEWRWPYKVGGETPVQSSTWSTKGTETRLNVHSPKMVFAEEAFWEEGSEEIGTEVEVQILDSMVDGFDHRVRMSGKLNAEYDSQFEDSEVAMMIRTSDEIRRVRVRAQRCSQMGLRRKHDSSGPVELPFSTQQHSKLCRIVTVNLDSLHKTEQRDSGCRFEKAPDKWELIVTVELVSDVTATMKSKPFRTTTRISHEDRNMETQQGVMRSTVEKVYHRIPSQFCEVVDYPELPDSPEFMELEEIAIESLDTNAVVNRVSSKLRQEMAKCRISEKFPISPHEPTSLDPFVMGRVVLRPDTKLDKQKVSSHYNRDLRIRYVVEQPDLPSLLKIMNRRTNCLTNGRRRANGFKTADEDFWWACGLCFFERRKKSTVKAHVVQRVCQKTSLRKEVRQRRRAFGHLKRYASCELSSEELEDFEPLTWESSLSV